jgi:hypothetical protein
MVMGGAKAIAREVAEGVGGTYGSTYMETREETLPPVRPAPTSERIVLFLALP